MYVRYQRTWDLGVFQLWSPFFFFLIESKSLENSIAQGRIKSTLLVLRKRCIVLSECPDWVEKGGQRTLQIGSERGHRRHNQACSLLRGSLPENKFYPTYKKLNGALEVFLKNETL